MKSNICIYFPLMIAVALGSCKKKGPANFLQSLSSCDTEVLIRDWELTPPVKVEDYQAIDLYNTIADKGTIDQGDNLPDYTAFTELFNDYDSNTSVLSPFAKTPYWISGDYIELKNKMNNPTFRYAGTQIISDVEQDVAFISGAYCGLQLWVNQKSVLKNYTTETIGGYQYLIEVHLKKGNNFVLAKLTNTKGYVRFFLKICSIRYANDNSLGRNYTGLVEHSLVKKNDTLKIKLWSPFINKALKYRLEIAGPNNQSKNLHECVLGKPVEISMTSLPEGLYTVRLINKVDTLSQSIFYGDYISYFNRYEKTLETSVKDQKSKNNFAILRERFDYLDTVKLEKNIEHERKIVDDISALSELYQRSLNSTDLFKDVPGLHLRARVSENYKADSYMIYIPKSYRPNKSVPLVVMMPYETGIRHFDISVYVADFNRIEHIKRLAERNGFAVLWTSARVFTNHNLTAMTPEIIFGTIRELRCDYNIDTNRIYAYGSCAGGELALFTANRYPSYFAAVGVEGPAIPDTLEKSFLINGINPSQQRIAEDFYNSIENYSSFPTYIIHSVNDEKSPVWKTELLAKEISIYGGDVTLKKLYIRKGEDLFFIDLMPDNKIMTDFFNFFNGKIRKISDTVTFATWQLKYNRSSWITIDQKPPGKKSFIKAVANAAHTNIIIKAENITEFTIDHKLFNTNKGLTRVMVITNGKKNYYPVFTNEDIHVIILPLKHTRFLKSHTTEGPINDFFTKPFLVVVGTTGNNVQNQDNSKASEVFATNWHANFLEDTCKIKKDMEVTMADLENYNLLLIGNTKSNHIVAKLSNQLPVIIEPNSICINKKKIMETI